jgi:hypothetical protein
MRNGRRFRTKPLLFVLAWMPALAACSSNDVSSADDAKRAYLGLDGSIDKAIDLGFRGFNAAQGANIPDESTAGALAGTLAVSGQVDQGASSNKQMRLEIAMAGYADVSGFAYETGVAADGGAADGGAPRPTLDMSLQMIPNGTLSGSLKGTFTMSGTLAGPVTLDLTFTGDLEPGPDGGSGAVVRKPGTTHITGSATSPAGTFAVDVTR